jgi:ankyrin repeat protein
MARVRRRLTDAEVVKYVRAVDKKNSAMFGLVKLRKLNVDVRCVDVPWCPGAPTTLLAYAARRQRDEIVGSLLRADADPRLRASVGAGAGAGASTNAGTNAGMAPRAFLQLMSLRYGAWVMKQVVGMRDAGLAAVAELAAAQEGNGVTMLCSLCKQSSVEPIKWLSCCETSHVCCETCMWKHASRGFNPMDNHEPLLCCPLCSHSSSSSSSASSSSSLLLNAITKEASRARFQAMPEKLPHKPKKLRFKAMCKAELRNFSIGHIQSKRVQNWWRAASDGNYLRLRALLEAGIDMDAKDENGETALLVAQSIGDSLEKQILLSASTTDTNAKNMAHIFADAKRCRGNYRKTVAFLLESGADPDIVSNAGCTVPLLRAQFAAWKSSQNQNQHQREAQPQIQSHDEDQGKAAASSAAIVTELIPLSSTHEGAGSWIIDGAFDEAFLSRLDSLWQSIPLPDVGLQNGSGGVDCDAVTSAQGRGASGGKGSNGAAQAAAAVRSSGEGGGRMTRMADKNRSYSKTCAVRTFFRDREEWICDRFREALAQIVGGPENALPRMRFMYYENVGGRMMPHVDLSKSDRVGPWQRMVGSTHTFLLHLRDCPRGGETVLLDTLLNQGGGIIGVGAGEAKRRRVGGGGSAAAATAAGRSTGGESEASSNQHVLASVAPRRGRLLLFPHTCPHAGLEVVDAPKLFLRGELW